LWKELDPEAASGKPVQRLDGPLDAGGFEGGVEFADKADIADLFSSLGWVNWFIDYLAFCVRFWF